MNDEWREQANCVGEDVVFFGNSDFGQVSMTGLARMFCATCPVTEPCLEVALGLPPYADFGVWGGTSAWERKLIRLERQKDAAHARR